MACLARQVAERRDDIAEREQAHVDVLALLKALPAGARLLLPLAAGQVNKMELAAQRRDGAGAVGGALLEVDGEDGVRAAATLIHLRCPCSWRHYVTGFVALDLCINALLPIKRPAK